MSEIDSITGILVTLEIANAQALYVMLGTDGTIQRMGNGTECNTELELFIGTSSGTKFASLRGLITPQFLQRLGTYADSNPQGKPCRLMIGLRQDDGKEIFGQWNYGTKSQGPPTDICNFVRDVVKITDHWYEKQKTATLTGE